MTLILSSYQINLPAKVLTNKNSESLARIYLRILIVEGTYNTYVMFGGN